MGSGGKLFFSFIFFFKIHLQGNEGKKVAFIQISPVYLAPYFALYMSPS